MEITVHRNHHIGYGSNISVNKLIDKLKKIMNPTFDKVKYTDEKQYDVKETLADTDKLYRWFGFKPKYNIENGLKDWLLKNNKG